MQRKLFRAAYYVLYTIFLLVFPGLGVTTPISLSRWNGFLHQQKRVITLCSP